MSTTNTHEIAWYRQAWHHFVESNYMTWFTDWMLKLGGKGAHGVLIITTLYMSAELYPGVNLPPMLNMVMFLVQMFMLDVGGLGLATLARSARSQGNTEGAKHAGRLSWFLIGIMIAGIVTVCVEQAISNFRLTPDAQNGINAAKIIIEVALVVARAFCAVLYGVVIHNLETHQNRDAQATNQPPDSSTLVDMINEAIDQRTQSLCTQINVIAEQMSTLSTQVSTQHSAPSESVHNFVDMDQFKQLSHVVYTLSNTIQQMHVSVTEVHNNVLQISGRSSSEHHRGKASRAKETTTVDSVSLPEIKVTGISQDKVNQVLTLFLQGMQWRDIPGNYSRTIKPIREAYESYVHTSASEM